MNGVHPRALCASVLVVLTTFGSSGCQPNAVTNAEAQALPEHEAVALPSGAVAISDMLRRAPEFASYWYQGLAEMNRYTLTQSRYGEHHEGEAVLIFVTEDFRTDRQVKFEGGSRENVESALKLNAYRRFYTGIYPYTMMTSSFLPARTDGPAWKVTASVQEWCGSSFQQFNRRGDEYNVELRSYFDGEGDTESTVTGLLEDELFARARRGPRALPTGVMEVIPAAHTLRMQHLPSTPQTATLSLAEVDETPRGSEPAYAYEIEYLSLSRTVTLYLDVSFPHQVLAWTEEDGARASGTTTAVLSDSFLLDYWSRHGADDGVYRDALGLTH